MSTGPHVIAITLLVAWILAALALMWFFVVLGKTWSELRARVRQSLLAGVVVLAVSVLIQILYWLGVGD